MPAALFALQSAGDAVVPLAAVRAGAGRRHPGRARDPARHAHPASAMPAPHGGLKTLVSQVLTFDYLGALAVSIAFPLLLVPQLGLIRTGAFFGLLNAAVAVWALWLFRAELRRVGAHALGLRADARRAGRRLRRRRPHHDAGRGPFYQDRVVFSETTPYQRIVVTRSARRRAPVPQRQPAVRRARRVPLPRGAGASGDGRARRAAAGAGAGRRRRHGGARDPQVPVGRARHAGRARPAHDAAVLDRAAAARR